MPGSNQQLSRIPKAAVVEVLGPRRSGITIRVGDTVRVRPRKGQALKPQAFEGVVVDHSGEGLSEMVTVEGISSKSGARTRKTITFRAQKVSGLEVVRGGAASDSKVYRGRNARGRVVRSAKIGGKFGRAPKGFKGS